MGFGRPPFALYFFFFTGAVDIGIFLGEGRRGRMLYEERGILFSDLIFLSS